MHLSIHVLLCLVSDRRNLTRDMRARTGKAFRPGTVANRLSHVKLYAAFSLHFQLQDFPAPVLTLLLFAEFLLRSCKAPKSVCNALSSLRTFHLLNGLPVDAFQDFQLSLFKRALPLTVRHVPAPAAPMPLGVLERLCTLSGSLGRAGRVFAALLATVYFTMARLSSVAPPRGDGYDTTRYPTLGDLVRTPQGFDLRLKWAKNRQAPSQALVAPLRPLGSSPACPVRLLEALVRSSQGSEGGAPLFQLHLEGGHRGTAASFFTAPVARGWLSTLLAHLGLASAAYTFHSLRRGACHLAFERGASLEDIKFLGGWRSQAVLDYLPAQPARARTAPALAGSPLNPTTNLWAH